ncbi:hypothetical protein [Sulfurovum sp.]|uniref:hypothetical protein n=1 Tax=Sulfurovum sp. TaxID=1969726 RepID=UPI002A368A77|nr:hypothetical protein [Sulfurovum sp.]MDD2450669.1 hypothetical protein [Sulfurovum sp.]MDD3499194.1 hypothetical protein [Sulfurovum sp.]MDY0402920.1 hypothetical protein [Sulfurovum sp.]
MPQQFTIHYACASLVPERTSHVTAIGVCDTTTKKLTTFSLEDAEKTLGAQCDREALEAHLLKAFFDFVASHSDAVWIHWHMDSVVYGFGVLKERFEMSCGQGAPEITATLNLPDKIFETMQNHCPEYPKLYQLFQENGINDHAILTGREEAASFAAGNYAAIMHSSRAKAKALAALYEKLQDNSLVLSCNRSALKLWAAGFLIIVSAIVYMLLKGV